MCTAYQTGASAARDRRGEIKRCWRTAAATRRVERRRRACPKRNGGRHCCQPPLRRAKDMPVFVTWSASAFRPSLTRSRSWLTSSGVAFHPTAPSCEEPARSTWLRYPRARLPVQPARPVHEVRNSEELQPSGQSRPMFRGPSWGNRSYVPLRSPKSRRTPGAASHKRQFPLPAPLPGWPRKEPKLFPLPAGGDRFFCPILARSAVAGFPGRLGLPPRSQESPCTSAPSRGSEKCGTKPVDNGDIGNKRRNLLRLPESRLLTTSAKCLNRLPSSPNRLISRASTRPSGKRC
jgi:hypothetical protein